MHRLSLITNHCTTSIGGVEFIADKSVTCKKIFTPVVHILEQPHTLVADLNTETSLLESNHEFLFGKSKWFASNLKWMAQKYKLRQDMFLIGPPSHIPELLIRVFASLINAEVEWCVISRDTTDSDIKQRREIRNGSALYFDQCAVQAAIHGRILVLEGIQKAERNVLPVLNNLLENREMNLEDGRFFVKADKYDELVKENGIEKVNEWKIIRVHQDFIVIAIGLPVPLYPGNSLDPPFRSRFQCRNIGYFNLDKMKEYIGLTADENILKAAIALSEQRQIATFPLGSFQKLSLLFSKFGNYFSRSNIFMKLYPYPLLPGFEQYESSIINSSLETFEISCESSQASSSIISLSVNESSSGTFDVEVNFDRNKFLQFVVKGGTSIVSQLEDDFISNSSTDQILVEMLMLHSIGDFGIIGSKGCGKSTLVARFSRILHYDVVYFPCYKDMSSRDFLQRRSTRANGDTFWEFSGIVCGALTGSLVILDGVEQLSPGTLSTLRSLSTYREVVLPDRTRLISNEKFNCLLKRGYTEKFLQDSGFLRIHPHFRLIIVARPFAFGGRKPNWLSEDILSIYPFVSFRWITVKDELAIISKSLPRTSSDTLILSKLTTFSSKLRETEDSMLKSISTSLSLRQLIRIFQNCQKFKSQQESLSVQLRKACLIDFTPSIIQESFDKLMEESGIKLENISETGSIITQEDDLLNIGGVQIKLKHTENAILVPKILFFENDRHTEVLKRMLQDWLLGEHLLLIGNQGVGKNKLADYFLQLLRLPRVYVQLHRDTSIQSLTSSPTLNNGILTYEDSPVILAMKKGYVLIVDEVDKAPTHVTALLKTLVEDVKYGQIFLADGRIISSNYSKKSRDVDMRKIWIHPDFRMIILANRPGFPFLGNDFYREIGDIFSCHAVDNPDQTSEIQMLRKYAPSVSNNILMQLTSCFQDLRELVDEGVLSYPFSTRELVNVTRHLENFPEDTDHIGEVLRNVFDFDQYDVDIQNILKRTLEKNSISLDIDSDFQPDYVIKTGHLMELDSKSIYPVEHWYFGEKCVTVTPHKSQVKIKQESSFKFILQPLLTSNSRQNHFSEELRNFNLQCRGGTVVVNCQVLSDDSVLALVSDPKIVLKLIDSSFAQVSSLDLDHFFPSIGRIPPQIQICQLTAFGLPHVLLLNPVDNQIILLDLVTRRITEIEIIGFSGVWFRASKVVKIPSQDSHIVLFLERSQSIFLVDMTEKISWEIQVGIKISNVIPFSSRFFLLEGESTNGSRFFESLCVKQDSHLMHEQPLLCDILTKPAKHTNSHSAIRYEFFSPTLLSDGSRIFKSTTHMLNIAEPEFFRRIVSGSASEISAIDELADFKSPDLKVQKDFCVTSNSLVASFLNLQNPKLSKIRITYLNEGRVKIIKTSFEGEKAFIRSLKDNYVVSIDQKGMGRVFDVSIERLRSSYKKWRAQIVRASQRGSKGITIMVNGKNLALSPEEEVGQDGNGNGSGDGDGDGDGSGSGSGQSSSSGGSSGSAGSGNPRNVENELVLGRSLEKNLPLELVEGKEFVIRQASQSAREIHEISKELRAKTLLARLESIKMTTSEAKTYASYLKNVEREIQQLKMLLDSREAQRLERSWIKNQTSGELDDRRLIEGISGERAIYKVRGDIPPDLTSQNEYPKRIKFLFDLSASMTRFNGHDGRLDRSLEAAVMIMEAFAGVKAQSSSGTGSKWIYEIIGHSGDTPDMVFVAEGTPPRDEKERLLVVKKMSSHSGYCGTGDSTMESISSAIKDLASKESDESIIVALTDANLNQYAISADDLSKLVRSASRESTKLTSGRSNVSLFLICIGTLQDQANQLIAKLPPGHGFVCLDTKEIPSIIQKIFAAALSKL